MTSQKIKDYEQAQSEDEQKEEDNSLDFKIPSTSGVLQKLEQAEKQELQREHKQEMEEEEKQGTGQAKARKQRQGGTICCCGVPHCRIGPFVEKV